MKTTNTSGTNNSMHKKDNNKGRYVHSRPHHRYNNNDSNSYDQRVRHHSKQSLEKYLNLAREATVSGDKISAEYYLQHADHFHRVYNGLNYTDEDGERKPMHRYMNHRHQRPAGQSTESKNNDDNVTNNDSKELVALESTSSQTEQKDQVSTDETLEKVQEEQKQTPPPLRARRGPRLKKNKQEGTEDSANGESSIAES